MKILIGNDDGIGSVGILALVKELARNHEVRVYAPMGNRSGFSHSLTVRQPIYVKQSDIFADLGVKAWEFSGTPADCIKLGLDIDKTFAPDIVIGGINHGPNMGMDVMYSGTCGVGMEGSLAGACGIAVSLDCHFEDGNYQTAAKVVGENLQLLFDAHIGTSVWNINVPNLAYGDLKGVELTQIGVQIYNDVYEKGEDEKGVFYSLGGYTVDHNQNQPNGDVEVVKNGKVSITPIKQNRTDFEELERCYDIFSSRKSTKGII
ncbi:MAG: 5'/3'-nucleotidase SurE [Bacillota bacterium]